MRKLLLSLMMLAVICSNANESTIGKLNEVNAEWKNNVDGQLLAASASIEKQKSFNDWIATHLMLVEQTLRERPVQHLSASQKENRFKLLDVLNSYWHAGTFPVNDYLSYKNPVFIDRIGTHCAVGYLMQQSGSESLARAIDADNKFVFVKSIKTKGVAEWASVNGFTIDELAWIQPGYPAAFTVAGMEKGLNGTVKSLKIDPSSDLLYAGGSFTLSTKGAMCNGVAVYISGIAGWDWVGLGTGVNGTVNSLLVHNDKLYVGGQFTTAGSMPASNIAIYDFYTQQWQSMGSLDSTVNTIAVYNNEIYAGGAFTGLVSKWTGTQWQSVSSGFIYNGDVRALEVYNNELLIGGNFDIMTGAYRRHVAAYDGTYMTSSGFGTVTPVNDFEVWRNTVYAACDVAVGTDTCALARFNGSDWEVVIKPFGTMMDYFNGTTIKQVTVADDRLFCVGDFFCSSGMIYGNRMMEVMFDTVGGAMISPILMMDTTIHTMVSQHDVITFGGDFLGAPGDSLNHVGQLLFVINKVPAIGNNLNTISVYPNPATDRINIQFKEFSAQNVYSIRILDKMGREVSTQQVKESQFSMDLSGNSAGVYTVQVVDKEGTTVGSKRVVIN